ncbi:MAG: hypothetical protein ACD_82C00062G0003 [uncultured bacterium]|nr:MAG: hypothetical protein ACD_82C00062G0003 [uncultured bacterium]KKP27248.1 MAG: hypothetical protein UR12_C0029G0003 [candidate division TM6 bacterium GW2011_GWF2_30_66]
MTSCLKHVFFLFCFFTITSFCKTNYNKNICDKKLHEDKWTWAYKKVFSDSECLYNKNLDGISFFKEDIKRFSQIIFSWNSARPKVGGFLFHIKTKNAKSKKWSDWHKMFYWGSACQRSYYGSNSSSDYIHVRLETGLNNLSEAFKVIIEPCGGADLGLIKSVCACISDFNKFKPDIIDSKLLNLKSVHIKDVPKISQRLLDHKESSRICSPTSCSMLLGFFNKYFTDALSFTDSVFDPALGSDGSYGNWCFNVAEVYCRSGGKVLCHVSRMNGFIDLYEKLLEGFPVIVSVRGKLEGGQKEYNSGHLIVVVGWDFISKSVICHDPAFYTNESTFVKYKLKTFLDCWGNSNKLAYVANFNL